MNKKRNAKINGLMKPRNNRPSMNRKIHVNLPEEVHKKLRVKCALKDVTIQGHVSQLIINDIKDISFSENRSKRDDKD